MDLWPEDRVLGSVFPEVRVRKAMIFARRAIPPFAAFILLWAYVQGGGLKGVSLIFTLKSAWPPIVASVTFLLLLPVQGYYWFGRRSLRPLSERQKKLYAELCARLSREPEREPDMLALATVLAQAMRDLDHEFLRLL